MVLSQKNNYCINKETVQNQALKKENWWLGISVGLWGAANGLVVGTRGRHLCCPGTPRAHPPRVQVDVTWLSWCRGGGCHPLPGKGDCLQAFDTTCSKNEGGGESILLYLKHSMICTKYYDYSGLAIIDSPTQPFSLRAVRFTNSTIF